MASYKLRIATENDSGIVDAVAVEVRNATGLQVKPVLQEIDRRELIVELTLNSDGSSSPRELAHRIKSSSQNLEVLGSWHALEEQPRSAPPSSRELFFCEDMRVPAVARRAFDDRVPTANWQPREGSHSAHWVLAVPVVGTDGRQVAALARRDGHYHRFSAKDATALSDSLISTSVSSLSPPL